MLKIRMSQMLGQSPCDCSRLKMALSHFPHFFQGKKIINWLDDWVNFFNINEKIIISRVLSINVFTQFIYILIRIYWIWTHIFLREKHIFIVTLGLGFHVVNKRQFVMQIKFSKYYFIFIIALLYLSQNGI